MKFKFYHEVYETEFVVEESTFPEWINHKQYNWFKLRIMESSN